MFTLANMMHLFPDELSGLRAQSFALTTISARSRQRFLFRHNGSL